MVNIITLFRGYSKVITAFGVRQTNSADVSEAFQWFRQWTWSSLPPWWSMKLMTSETRHSSASKAEIRWIRSRHHCARTGVICPPKLSEHSRKSGRRFLQLTLRRSWLRVGFLALSGCVKLAMHGSVGFMQLFIRWWSGSRRYQNCKSLRVKYRSFLLRAIWAKQKGGLRRRYFTLSDDEFETANLHSQVQWQQWPMTSILLWNRSSLWHRIAGPKKI